MQVPYRNIPTYNILTKEWTKTTFENQIEFGHTLLNEYFKEPGKYEFDEDTQIITELGKFWEKNKYYTTLADGTADSNRFWKEEEYKSRLGVFLIKGDKKWYFTRDYYFFLNYCPIINKERGQSETMASLRDGQYHMMMYEKIAELFHLHAVELKRRQFLYEQPHSSLVLAHDGWITMGDLQIGDVIRNPDGTTCNVIDKSNNGLKQIYTVVLDDGTEIKCGEHHLWEVSDGANKKKKFVLKTSELIKKGLYSEYEKQNEKGVFRKEYRFRIDNIKPIQYEDTKLPIDPYVLGVLIGDGSMSTGQLSFCTYDEDIADKVFKNLGDDYEEGCTKALNGIDINFGIKYKHRFNYEKNKEYDNIKYGCNPLIRELEKLKLMYCISHNKFIPEIYKYTSIENRIQLIQGLMDTDGYINKVGRDINYTTVSKQLALDVWQLFKELGLSSVISTKKNEYGLFYRVRICGNVNIEVFSTFRKQILLKLRNEKNKRKSFKTDRRIIEIRKENYQEECSCIMVDHPNHLYITDGYTITHNSFTHAAKTVNFLYFENKKTLKWFASDESFIDDVNGSWKFLNAYINHLNIYTPWFKDFNPSQFPQIQQVTKIKTQGNRWITDGNESTLVAKSLAKDPKKGVGGPAYWIWYEEGGIAPTADETLTFINPNLESGMEKVGSFCIGGSVGDLKQCAPLKEFLLNPTTHSFLGVPTTLYDDSGIEKKCGLFIPAQWGMPQATDEWGNSLPEKALELLHKAEFIGFKAGEDGRIQDEEPWINLPEKQYIIKKSQNPKNIKEAFAYREESKFPIKRIEKQQSYIKDNPEFAPKKVELWEDENGKIRWKECKGDDTPYPVDPKSKDKNGVVLMWKPPESRIEMFTNFGGVDNLEVGASETSHSMFSIYIVEGNTEEVYYTEEGQEKIRLVGDRILASWTGRYDNLDDSNRQGEYLIRLYNAFTLCERNKPNFITHMIKAGYRHLLATQGDVPIYKEVSDIIDTSKNAEIGIYMDATGKKQGIADDYLYQWLVTEVDAKYKLDKNGLPTEEKLKTWYNLNYVYDYNLFEELKNDKENTDRRDALRLAIMLKTVYGAKGIKKKRINTENKPFIEKKKISRTIILLDDINYLNYNNKKSNKNTYTNLLG